MGKSCWRYRRLIELARIKPGEQAVVIRCDDHGPKTEVLMLHRLAYQYGFKVACRPVTGNKILVWVKKPGFDRNILKIWDHDV